MILKSQEKDAQEAFVGELPLFNNKLKISLIAGSFISKLLNKSLLNLSRNLRSKTIASGRSGVEYLSATYQCTGEGNEKQEAVDKRRDRDWSL